MDALRQNKVPTPPGLCNTPEPRPNTTALTELCRRVEVLNDRLLNAISRLREANNRVFGVAGCEPLVEPTPSHEGLIFDAARSLNITADLIDSLNQEVGRTTEL